jgi:hypothetical protein
MPEPIPSGTRQEILTAADMTPAEQAAWDVAVDRGLRITRADLRTLLEAARPLLAEAWGGDGRNRRAAEPCRPLMEASTEDLRDARILIHADKRKRLRAAFGIPEDMGDGY